MIESNVTDVNTYMMGGHKMKVKELVEILKKCNQDDEIIITGNNNNTSEYYSYAIDCTDEPATGVTEIFTGKLTPLVLTR